MPHTVDAKFKVGLSKDGLLLMVIYLLNQARRVPQEAEIVVDVQEPKFVSRAALSLNMLSSILISMFMGLLYMDAGLSTEGLPLLLGRGARKCMALSGLCSST
jgi:predicted rRNA methylase YqxC with S4 and FtsJ domains